jgi:hypothetical protein
LINGTSLFNSDVVVLTSGFTTSGDGGSGSWKQNGVTGQTASQSPAQLVDGLLNDGNGKQWAIVTDGGTPTLAELGAVASQSLSGADTVADSYFIVLALLGWCDSNFYLGVSDSLGSGYYRLSQPLYVNQSLVFNGKGKNESYFHANHLLGPTLRFGKSNSGFKNMGVTGGATRRAAAYSAQQIGVLFEGDDVPELDPGAPRLLHCTLENYYIFGHPSSLLHIVGPAFTAGSLNNPDLNTAKGHGISFDRGELTNRVNLLTTLIGGVCRIGEGRINNCGGHAIVAGSPTSSFSTPALRIEIDNIEGEDNATDAAVRFLNTPVWLRGTNFEFKNSGLGVNAGGTCAFVAGRNIHLTNNRALGEYASVYTIGSFDELPTEGIFIDGMSIINPLAPLDPAVVVTLPAGETIAPKNIFITQGEMANITKIAAVDATIGAGDFRRIAGLYVNGAILNCWKENDTTVNNSTTLIDDPDLRTWIAPNDKVFVELEVEYESTESADIRLQFYSPVGSTFKVVTSGSMKVGTDGLFTQQSVTTGLINTAGGGAGVARIATIKGYVTNGANEGYVGIKFAQLSAEATDTKVLAGISTLKITKLIS